LLLSLLLLLLLPLLSKESLLNTCYRLLLLRGSSRFTLQLFTTLLQHHNVDIIASIAALAINRHLDQQVIFCVAPACN
jgi:hypothetical protein